MHEISIHKLVDVTVPPFHPNRVESCDLYVKRDGDYEKQEIKKSLHIIQETTNNLKRKISDFSDKGLFIWYSGNSITNNRGSLMGYFVADGDCFTFYLTLTGDKNWNAEKVHGLTTKEIKTILDTETRVV